MGQRLAILVITRTPALRIGLNSLRVVTSQPLGQFDIAWLTFLDVHAIAKAHPLQSTTNFEKAKDAKIAELELTLAAFAKIPFAYDF